MKCCSIINELKEIESSSKNLLKKVNTNKKLLEKVFSYEDMLILKYLICLDIKNSINKIDEIEEKFQNMGYG